MKNATVDNVPQAERHPLQPFLPKGAKVLLLGTFPPKRNRWAMEFYYPNFQNDMWRIMGLVFFRDKGYFLAPNGKRFDKDMIACFCREKGIALSDTAEEVVRLKDNASDKFLQIIRSRDVGALLDNIPECRAVVTTGQKATETLTATLDCPLPKVGESEEFLHAGRKMKLYRMPSSSRAYPMAIERKAAYYEEMFREAGLMG